MPHQDFDMDDPAWDRLMDRIRRGKVTPFVGAAASSPPLRTGREVANAWASELDDYKGDPNDLINVATFLSVTQHPMAAKVKIADALSDKGTPDFDDPVETYGLLADLPLPIYITTNYDDYMAQALRARGKSPHEECCRWNEDVRKHGQKSVLDEPGFVPTAQEPVVFHLHGVLDDLHSIVISEDDYLTFLVELSLHRDKLLPLRIQQAFSGTSLMFMGYSLADWTFKVIFRAFVFAMEADLRRRSVSVQLPKKEYDAQSYLAKYLRRNNIDVYWGDLKEFVGAIRSRWDSQSTSSTYS